MDNPLDGTILDLETMAASIAWELFTDNPFDEVVPDRRIFTKEIAGLIGVIYSNEITSRGSYYLRSVYTVNPTLNIIEEFCDSKMFSKLHALIFQTVLLGNYYYELTLNNIISHIDSNHWEIWMVDKTKGVYILRLINYIRIEEWEQSQGAPDDDSPPF